MDTGHTDLRSLAEQRGRKLYSKVVNHTLCSSGKWIDLLCASLIYYFFRRF